MVQDVRKKMPGGNSKRNISQIKKIARHHSATDSGNAESFASFHVNHHGWSTSGYHEVILRDGTVQIAYDPEVITNGVGGHNTNTYHICVVGNSNFTDEQEKVFDERAKAAMDRFSLKVSDVLGHNEFSDTGNFRHSTNTCPGINMNAVRNRLSGSGSKSSSSGSGSSKNIEWVGTNDKGKRIEAIVDSVNFYDTQRWTNPTGQFKKGEGWIVDNLYRVNGSLQYRVQNSKGDLYYITARPDLVRIVDNSSGGSGQSINQMADRIINDSKAPTGNDARRRWLGVDEETYQKVRAEVNRRF